MTASKEQITNTSTIKIKKRDGRLEPLNIDKIHFVVEEACEGLAGVSSSQIEINANIQFYDGMTTKEVQQISTTGVLPCLPNFPTFFVYLSSFLLLAGLTDPAIESHDPKTATPVSYHAILV